MSAHLYQQQLICYTPLYGLRVETVWWESCIIGTRRDCGALE